VPPEGGNDFFLEAFQEQKNRPLQNPFAEDGEFPVVPPQFTACAASWDTNISLALYRAPPVTAYCWFGRPLGKEFTGLASPASHRPAGL